MMWDKYTLRLNDCLWDYAKEEVALYSEADSVLMSRLFSMGRNIFGVIREDLIRPNREIYGIPPLTFFDTPAVGGKFK